MPIYRAPLFEALADGCPKGLGVFAGMPRPIETIETCTRLEHGHLTRAENLHLFRGRFYLCYQRGLLEWLNRWDPEVLIVEANPRYLSTPPGVRWMKARHRPVIGWGLGAPALSGFGRSLRTASRRSFLRQFDGLITYSQQGAQEYRALGFPAERVFVALNAAAQRPQHALPVRPSQLTPRQVTLLFVGRLQARKRVDLLLRAVSALPEDARPHVWIVGDGPARQELESLARQIYPQTLFLGARHGQDLEPIFRSADLFVLPGTGGLAVQQAMSFGLPVMVGQADGTQTDLVRPVNGWQLPPADLAALTQALTDALQDVPRLRRMGAESYRITREEINLERMVEIFGNAVRAVL